MYTDANAYTGVSYYRLKIVDLANNISYSQIVTIAAKTKGGGGGNPHNNIIASDTTVSLQAAGKILSPFNTSLQKITVGPNPNNGNFWFIVNGIDKETVAILYSIDGKQLKQFRVKDQQQQQVNGLRSGIYILKVPGFEAYKIIVHGNSSGFNNIITESPLIKN
jgi:hypothetical protein